MKKPLIQLAVLALLTAACDTTTPVPTATMHPTLTQASPTDTAVVPPTETQPQPVEATATIQTIAVIPTPTGTIVDAAPVASPTLADAAPSPTPIQAVSTGQEMTALQALDILKKEALAIYPDARLALLANSRPGQQKNLLSSSLGDPTVNEPTPGGKGRNWTLVAVSPSKRGATAFGIDGTTVDLVEAKTVTDEVIDRFSASSFSTLDLAKMDISAMPDSDAIAQAAGEPGAGRQIGIALMAPDGLGVGPLPTPETGGSPPQLAYELFSTDPAQQLFIFFDALTGKIVLDSRT